MFNVQIHEADAVRVSNEEILTGDEFSAVGELVYHLEQRPAGAVGLLRRGGDEIVCMLRRVRVDGVDLSVLSRP